MDFFDLIPAYLDGSLDPGERQAFETEMANNPDLRLAVDTFPDIRDAVHVGAEEEIRKTIDEARLKVRKSRRVRIRRWKAAASVLVIVAAGMGLFVNTQYSTTSLMADAYRPNADLGTLKAEGPKDSLWSAVKTAWDAGNLDQALAAADDLISAYPDDLDIRYRMAHLSYQAGSYDQATALFGQLRETRSYGNDAEFHSALILIRTGETERGIELLDSIATDPDHRFAQDAQSLQSDLGSVWHRLAFR